MKYTSTDRLCDFEFHDADFTLDVHDGWKLGVWADHLNIHADAQQNPFDTDMEIDRAYIIFENFNLISYEPGRTWKQNENGELYTDEPQITHHGDEALKHFTEQLTHSVWVYDFDITSDNMYFIDGSAIEPFFTAYFTFDKITIEWDDYRQQAWYVIMKNEQNTK